jgi:hypothetical protein
MISCMGALALWLSGCTTCEQLQEEAADLVLDDSRCRAGDTCQKVDLFEAAGQLSCLGALQCTGALNTQRDLNEFRRRARLLAQQGATICRDQCVVAACLDPRELEAVCDTQLGQCVLVPVSP